MRITLNLVVMLLLNFIHISFVSCFIVGQRLLFIHGDLHSFPYLELPQALISFYLILSASHAICLFFPPYAVWLLIILSISLCLS